MHTVYLPASDQWLVDCNGIIAIHHNVDEALWRVLNDPRLQMSAAPLEMS